MGLACLLGRQVLYRTAVDATGLLRARTPLEWATYILSLLAVGLFAAASGKQTDETLLPAPVSAFGQLLGAVGLGWTALAYPGEMPGFLGNLWRILGIAAAACLIWSAYCAIQGKTPHFAALLVPCLFWLAHLIDNYRGWSGAPQLQSYLFALLGTMSMAILTYYTAAGTIGMGKPRLRKFAALTAGYFCAAAALPGKNGILYLLCALWALSSL